MMMLAKAAGEPTAEEFGLQPQGVSFKPKTTLLAPLQAADIIAYEGYRYMQDFARLGKDASMRGYLKGLANNRRIHSAFHTRETIQAFAERMRKLVKNN
jgi:hypothetical protein